MADPAPIARRSAEESALVDRDIFERRRIPYAAIIWLLFAAVSAAALLKGNWTVTAICGAIGVSFAVGPTVASLVLAVASWQWLFAINDVRPSLIRTEADEAHFAC